MTDLTYEERKAMRRAAEDARDACNRHYGPFVDLVAHPLNILALLDMADRAALAHGDQTLADTQRSIIEAAERRGYERAMSDLWEIGAMERFRSWNREQENPPVRISMEYGVYRAAIDAARAKERT